jgi:hypothetical protein
VAFNTDQRGAESVPHGNRPLRDWRHLLRREPLAIDQAEKLLPQPQELVAFGFLKTNPSLIFSLLKSISVPLR